jgi:hypothetical protein
MASGTIIFVVYSQGNMVPKTITLDLSAPVAPVASVPTNSGWTGDGTGGGLSPTVGNSVRKRNRGGSAPKQPKTITDSGVDIGGDGLGYSSQKITENTQPMDNAGFATWNAGYNGTFSETTSSNGGVFRVGYRFLDPSGDFPGPDGGSRGCLDFRVDAQLMINSITIELPDFGGSSSNEPIEITHIILGGGAGIGYTSLSFDPLDEATMTQSGFGWTVGLGFQATKIVDDGSDDEEMSDSPIGVPAADDVIFTPMPMIGIEFPTLNPGTARLETFTIFGFILPLETTTVMLNMGGSF